MKKRWGCTTAGEAQQIPQAALVACFGDAVANISHSQQNNRRLVIFPNLLPNCFRKWLSVLAQELAIRMRREFEMNQRQPKLFQLYYRSGKFKNSADHSRSAAMPSSAIQILSSPAYSDTVEYANTIEIERRSEVELPTEGGDGDVEVQGDLSELRGVTLQQRTHWTVVYRTVLQRGQRHWLRFLKTHLSEYSTDMNAVAVE